MPLSERMKPQNLNEFFGQNEILGEGKLLRRLIETDRLTSCILYGPPGCGKTSLARIVSSITKSEFITMNAVTDGLKELREVIEDSKKQLEFYQKRTLVFIDEIHRFNKTQQDGLLPAVEKGIIILIGATTFNPFFYLVPALASRTTIFEMKMLTNDDLKRIFHFSLNDKNRGFGNKKIELENDVEDFLITQAGGDARKLLNAIELGILSTKENSDGVIKLSLDNAREMIQKRVLLYDRDGDLHYDIISAFIKSVRGSDVNASLYYLARMLESGEDIRFIARRCAILAAEDIGLAEPFALVLAQSAFDLVEKIGMPESALILSELVTFLAGSPKSNSTTIAIGKATEFVKQGKTLDILNHLRDKSYKGAKKLGHGEGYLYPHDFPGHVVEQEYIEEKLDFYNPGSNGKEKIIKEYLNWIKEVKERQKQ